MLSKKDIPPKERLIFALDVSSADEARRLVEELGDSVHFYKLGLELFMAGSYYDLIEELISKGKKVFVDLKFFDVPQTVRSAVRQLKNKKVTFATVHGNEAILEAAVKEKDGIKILAVTVLTSLDQSDIDTDMHVLSSIDQKDIDDLVGHHIDIKDLVLSRAKRALNVGCDGVISSGLEAPFLRESFGERFIVVTPGIRPSGDRPADDQKRTVNVVEAFENGADYIVVGRPIKNAPNPKEAAEEIQKTIAGLFS